MAGANLTFACTCGKVQGTLHDITDRSGSQLQCHCDECRRAVIWLGNADPGPDGMRYYQTTPSHVSLDAGVNTLRAFTWKNLKLLRWYAPCCNAPLFNTLNSPKWAFASIIVDRLADPAALGAVKSHAFIEKPNGKRGHTNLAGFMLGFAKRIIGGRLSGSWRDTPFFDATGATIAPVQTLTHDDRTKAQL
jgi:hypothetical protein